MSKSNRRPTTNSRGSSSTGHRALSVTEAVQSIRLTETASEYPIGRRRTSHRDTPSSYQQSPYETNPYALSTLDPSVLDSYPTTTRSPYSEQPGSSASPRFNSSASMSYPSYTQAPLTNPYRQNLPPRSSPQYGKLTNLIEFDPTSRRRLNEVGYTNPSTGASMSRSMSGPSLPSMLSSTYEEVRKVGREFVERRRRTINRPRREKKILLRQAVLPSTPRICQAEDLSGSIDYFVAHSPSYGSVSSYTAGPSNAAYPGTSASTHYDNDPYSNPYTSSSSSGGFPSTTRGYHSSTPAHVYTDPRRPTDQSTPDPVVIETPSKPQCWDHGCNGRQFSTFSNLLRHQREKSGSSTKSVCHRCGAEFTRKTARDGHLAHDKCKQKSPGR